MSLYVAIFGFVLLVLSLIALARLIKQAGDADLTKPIRRADQFDRGVLGGFLLFVVFSSFMTAMLSIVIYFSK
jgi:hypothetical protein